MALLVASVPGVARMLRPDRVVQLRLQASTLLSGIPPILRGALPVGCGAGAIRRGTRADTLELLREWRFGRVERALDLICASVPLLRRLVAARRSRIALGGGLVPGTSGLGAGGTRRTTADRARRACIAGGFQLRGAGVAGLLAVCARLFLIGGALIAFGIGLVPLRGGVVGIRRRLIGIRGALVGIRGGPADINVPLLCRARSSCRFACLGSCSA